MDSRYSDCLCEVGLGRFVIAAPWGMHWTMMTNTGLIYMRARYYDPALGRFISEDPARDGGNWYAYAGGNPVGHVDPDGRSAEDDYAEQIAAFMRGMASTYNLAGNVGVAAGMRDMWRGRALESAGLAAGSPAAISAGRFVEAIGAVEVRGGSILKIAAVLMRWTANYAEGMQEGFLDYFNDFIDSVLSVL